MDSRQFDLEGFNLPSGVLMGGGNGSSTSFSKAVEAAAAATAAASGSGHPHPRDTRTLMEKLRGGMVVAADKSLLEEQLGWKVRVDRSEIPLVDTAPHLVRDSNLLVWYIHHYA